MGTKEEREGKKRMKEEEEAVKARVEKVKKMVEAADAGTPFVMQKESKVREAFEQIVENVRAFVEGKEVKSQ